MNPAPRPQIEAIIALLEEVQKRLSMFIMRHDDISNLGIWLNGFLIACSLFDHRYSVDIVRQVYKDNAWERHADGIRGQMHERGLSDEEMVQESLRLEIDMWKRRRDETPASDS